MPSPAELVRLGDALAVHDGLISRRVQTFVVHQCPARVGWSAAKRTVLTKVARRAVTAGRRCSNDRY
jgi:hypothetical protein